MRDDQLPPDQKPRRDVPRPSGYESVYDHEGRRVIGSPSRFSAKIPIIAILIALLVSVGIAFTIYEAEPLQPWRDLTQLRAAADEGHLYLLIETNAGNREPPWGEVAYTVAIDTYEAGRGATVLPTPSQAPLGTGVEFVLSIAGPEASRIRVLEGYDPHAGSGPVQSARNTPSRFKPMEFVANPVRYTPEGVEIPAVELDRGVLRFASDGPDGGADHSRADLALGEGAIELRIPWALLNVTDPSSHQVLHSDSAAPDSTTTSGFRFYVFSHQSPSAESVADAIPEPGEAAELYQWEEWDDPAFRVEPKQGWEAVRAAMQSIPDHPG